MMTRLAVVGVIVLAAIGLAAILIQRQLAENAPAGEFVTVEPNSYPLHDGLSVGAADAPVKVDVWEDFQCPACGRFTEQIEPLIVTNYVAENKVRYTYHHFPFLDGNGAGSGGESDQAANAAMCANDQDQFWDYHDMLFANQNGENIGAFANNRLRAFADSIGLDMDAFDACFDANEHETLIEDDYRAGNQLGVSGTPSVFVNGVHVGQPGFIPSYEEISQAIEAALAGQ